MLSLKAETADELTTLMQSPGGFAWWYVDLIDAQGRGLVLVWSFGLPFLPGSRRNPTPTSRPSVSLALYEQGRSTFYLLQTYAPEQAALDGPGRFRFGDSRFELRSMHGSTTLHAELQLPIPAGGRLTGTVQARGASCQLPPAVEQANAHRWAPLLAAGEGRAQLASDRGLRIELEGRAYADSNGSQQPLHALGIESWSWGRVALPGRELIYYFVAASCPDSADVRLVLEVFPDGRILQHAARAHWRIGRRSIYGLRWYERLQIESASGLAVTLRFTALVDDGPFYLRFLVAAQDHQHGGFGVGLAEQVAPEQVDRAWQRPFVRMRTHETGAANSIWLPLFSGPARGRVKRLFGHWLASGAREGTAA